jgi:hypothetical protein
MGISISMNFVGGGRGFVVIEYVLKESIIWSFKYEICMSMSWSWKKRKTQDFRDEGSAREKEKKEIFQKPNQASCFEKWWERFKK